MRSLAPSSHSGGRFALDDGSSVSAGRTHDVLRHRRPSLREALGLASVLREDSLVGAVQGYNPRHCGALCTLSVARTAVGVRGPSRTNAGYLGRSRIAPEREQAGLADEQLSGILEATP
jgi:hypothetical protein